MPKRIQRKRTKGWRMPPGAVYVGRGSRLGNPYVVGRDYRIVEDTRFGGEVDQRLQCIDSRLAVDLYRIWLNYMHISDRPRQRPTPAEIESLRGKDLACWCPLTDAQGNHVPCHADVLLELANGDTE